MPRTWLFAPGHNEKVLSKVFTAGADVVLLDLEDSVPPHLKEPARDLVADIARQRSCWVRVNKPLTDDCRRDLEMLGGLAAGLRLPKVESAREVEWVAAQAPGVRLDCTIESARGSWPRSRSLTVLVAHRSLMAVWILQLTSGSQAASRRPCWPVRCWFLRVELLASHLQAMACMPCLTTTRVYGWRPKLGDGSASSGSRRSTAGRFQSSMRRSPLRVRNSFGRTVC